MNTIFGARRESNLEPPIEMRFVDLFMIIVTTLMLLIVILSIISAFVGSTRIDVAPRITSKGIPPAVVGNLYRMTIAAEGGSLPYSWKITDGSLPTGFSFDVDTGTISGIPKAVGRIQFSISLTDADNRSDDIELAIEILPSSEEVREVEESRLYVLGTGVLIPSAQKNEPYNFQMKATGGNPPYSWVIVEGDLPPGISFTKAGMLTGNPTVSDGIWTVGLKVSDSNDVSSLTKIDIRVEKSKTPFVLRLLVFIETIIRIIGYLMVASGVILYLFADIEEGVVHQQGRTSPWTRFRKRLGR